MAKLILLFRFANGTRYYAIIIRDIVLKFLTRRVKCQSFLEWLYGNTKQILLTNSEAKYHYCC